MDGIITRERLFEVQRRALNEAADKPGFAFFMEQGLGKTLTVLHEFHEKVSKDLADVLVITCPMSLRGTWRDEAKEWGYPYEVIVMDERLPGADWGYPQYPTIVCNEKRILERIRKMRGRPFVLVFHYELALGRGRDMVEHLIGAGRKIYWALDESVRIKGPTSRVGELLYFLSEGKHRVVGGVYKSGPKKGKEKYIVARIPGREPVEFRRILSGTPAPQGPHDLWSQLRFLGKMEDTAYFAWRHLYCKMGGFMKKQVMGPKNLDVMKIKIGPFAFRAKKDEWTDLPEKLWAQPREVEMHPKQRKAYLEIMHEMVLEIGPDEYITAEMQVIIKNKLQQIGSGWIYDNEKNVHEIVPIADNPKLQDLKEFLENIHTKVLVFYYFQPTRDYLRTMAEEMGLGHVFLESGLKMAEFEARKRAFNNDDAVQVAFCQTDAVREGHTLLGTAARRCYTTYFVENSYNLYSRLQAEDRNHRHGQYNPVTYHDVVTSKEDRKVIKALQKKQELQETLLAEFTAYREGKHSLQGY